MQTTSADTSTRTRDALFPSTRWTVVLDAAGSHPSSDQARQALAELCQIYWRPIYLFLRRQGVPFDEAEDLTQAFFAHLIEKQSYSRADRAKGRFRSFLLGALNYFLSDTRKHEAARKRGGESQIVQLNRAAIAEAEARAAELERSHPNRLYEREWAAALLRQTLGRLAEECALAGKKDLFDNLKSYLPPGMETRVPYDQIAPRIGRPIATLRSDVARLRTRFRAILREEVRSTLLDAADVDEELRYLWQVMVA